jgi:hypothetical protein
LQLIPPSTVKLNLKAGPPGAGSTTASGDSRSGTAPRLPGAPKPVPGRRTERREPAWWTARATAGEVTPGFSKAEMLKPKAEDPRAPGGILQRVEELLEDLRGDSGV